MRTTCSLLLLMLCVSSAAEGSGKERIRVYFPNGEHVQAELAASPESRERGLMFRKSMGPAEGMLFVFGREEIQPFWMKNMHFAIDILWLSRERRIVHMVRYAPPCRSEPCPFYTPLLPSAYVLEVIAGRSDELGLKVGDRLEFTLPAR